MWPFGKRSKPPEPPAPHDPRGADLRVGDLVEFIGTPADAEWIASVGLPLLRPGEGAKVAAVYYCCPRNGRVGTGVGIDLCGLPSPPEWAFPARLFRKVPPRSQAITDLIAKHTGQRQSEAA